MAIELSLRKPFSLPRVFLAQNNESQHDFHWVGQKQDAEKESGSQGQENKNPPTKESKPKYRSLADITLGEVEDAYKLFEHQLLPAQKNWLGRNYFCQIPLKRKHGYPPLLFGRVKTCYPSDGVFDNIDELEMYFPQKNDMPDVLHVHKDEVSRSLHKQVQSYFVRVWVLATAEERAELAESGPLLNINGFQPEYISGYLDLLEMSEGNQSVYPFLYVIGSRWFDAIPDSLQAEMRAKLKEMIGWGKQVFNYHPEWLGNGINSLNRVLGFKYAFTPIVLTEPGDAQEITFIVSKRFEQKILFTLKAEK